MSKIIYFIKVLAYDPTNNGVCSRYQGYSQIALQEADPGINEVLQSLTRKDIALPLKLPIFSSPLLRAKQSAKFFQKIYKVDTVLVLDDLCEIKFDLRLLVTESEFNEHGSTLVRSRFVEGFIKNSLLESREDIKSKFDQLLELFNSLNDGRYVAISHSFTMKLFQLYSQGVPIFSNPMLLRKHFPIKEKTFAFGNGFTFEV